MPSSGPNANGRPSIAMPSTIDFLRDRFRNALRSRRGFRRAPVSSANRVCFDAKAWLAGMIPALAALGPIVALGLMLQTGPVLAQPALTSSTPAAVAPGKTIDLVLTGQKLDDPLQIWSSFPAKIELVPLAEPKPGAVREWLMRNAGIAVASAASVLVHFAGVPVVIAK